MKFKIHMDFPDGEGDSFVVEGDTVEDIKEKAEEYLSARGLKDEENVSCWSEELK